MLEHRGKVLSPPATPPERRRESGRNAAWQNFHLKSLIVSALPPRADMCRAPTHVRFVPYADIHRLVGTAALTASLALLSRQFEPSFGDFKQIGLFFFASCLLRGSQSFLSVAAKLLSFTGHAIAAETFRKNRFRGEDEDVDGPGRLLIGPRSNFVWSVRADEHRSDRCPL